MKIQAPDDFDWGALRSFLVVARTGRLTVAAHQLGLDHSTLSRRMQTLEQNLEARLFDRRSQGYSLTQQGEALLKFGEKMEELALGVVTQVGRSKQTAVGTIRIGATDGFGTLFLSSCLPKLRNSHPGLSVQLVTLPRVISLSKREADIAIGLSRPTEGRLYGRKLTDFEWGIYASAGYLESHPAISDIRDLGSHRLIGYISDLIYAQELEDVLSVWKDAPVAFSSSNLIVQYEAARAGCGLCVLPHYIASCPDNGLRRVLSTQVSVIGSYWMTVHSDMRQLARVRIVCDFIAKEVRKSRSRFIP